MCFPDFCFSNRKACDLYSPENLSGDHRKHRGKSENRGFSPALQMGQFHLKISPKNEKNDRRSGRRRIKKMVDHFFIFQKNSLHLKMTNFSNPSRWAISLSRKILRGPYSPQRVENQNRRHEKLNSKYLRKIFFLEFAGSEAAILSYIFFACVTGSCRLLRFRAWNGVLRFSFSNLSFLWTFVWLGCEFSCFRLAYAYNWIVHFLMC